MKNKGTKCSNECVLEPDCKGVWQEECNGPHLAESLTKEPKT